MSQTYPCPNPMCSHQFTAHDLSGVAAVTCPLCGMVIQLRAAAPQSPPPPPAPTAATVATLPPTVATGPPTYDPGETGPPIVRARKRGKSRDALTYSLVIGGFLLLATFGLLGSFVAFKGGVNKAFGGRGGFKNSAFNYNLVELPGWEENPAMKSKINVSELVLKKSDALAYFGLDVIDFKDHTPSPRELDDEARRKLRAAFAKNLETEKTSLEKADPVAGQEAHHIIFVGETPEQSYAGEVVFIAHQGIGYWLYSFAAGDAKPFDDAFKQLRKGFSLLGERSDFKPSQAQHKVYPGDKVKGYQLTDKSGRWKLYDDPTAHDDAADIALRAPDPTNPKKEILAVDVVVMSVKLAGDPVQTAKKHIIKKYADHGNPGVKIRDVGDEEPRDRVGNANGKLLKWHVVGAGYERFAVVGVVPRGDDVLVLFGDCPSERRNTWETAITQLIDSLHVSE